MAMVGGTVTVTLMLTGAITGAGKVAVIGTAMFAVTIVLMIIRLWL